MKIGTIISRALILLVAASLMAGCGAAKGRSSKKLLTKASIDNIFLLPVKFHRQNEKNRCGIVALRSVLDFYEVDHEGIERIFNAELNATRLISIVNYADRYLDTRTERLGYEEIAKIVKGGDPVILLQKVDGNNHYSVVKGFVVGEEKIIINDGYNENVVVSLSDESAICNNIAIIFNRLADKKTIEKI